MQVALLPEVCEIEKEVTRILGRGITEQIFLQLRGKRDRRVADESEDPAGTQSSLLQFR